MQGANARTIRRNSGSQRHSDPLLRRTSGSAGCCSNSSQSTRCRDGSYLRVERPLEGLHAINRFSEDIIWLSTTRRLDSRATAIRGETAFRRRKRADPCRDDGACQRYIAASLSKRLSNGAVKFGRAGRVESRHQRAGPERGPISLSGVNRQIVNLCPPQVVLELGTHAEFVPHDASRSVRSAEEFPDVVTDGDVASSRFLQSGPLGKSDDPPRGIHRSPEKLLPSATRDTITTWRCWLRAIRAEPCQTSIYSQSVKHKETFYPCAWAQYQLARLERSVWCKDRTNGGVGAGLQEYGPMIFWDRRDSRDYWSAGGA